MSKRSIFTTITPLPSHVTRETVIETLHSHTEMIDLNPLVIERHAIKPPGKATAEEYHCQWYAITDRISYFPGIKGKVTYNACFHDLAIGLQTHVYAPAGLDIKEKWSVGGTLPGEPQEAVEIGQGIPLSGLYLREDIDMTCNFVMTSFVKKTLQNAHNKLIARLVVKTQLSERDKDMERQANASMYSSDGSKRSPQMLYAGSSHSSQGLISPGMPSPAFQQMKQGHKSYQPDQQQRNSDARYSTQSTTSHISGFNTPSPGMNNMDPAYRSANPYQDAQFGDGTRIQQPGSYMQHNFVAELPAHERGISELSADASLPNGKAA